MQAEFKLLDSFQLQIQEILRLIVRFVLWEIVGAFHYLDVGSGLQRFELKPAIEPSDLGYEFFLSPSESLGFFNRKIMIIEPNANHRHPITELEIHAMSVNIDMIIHSVVSRLIFSVSPKISSTAKQTKAIMSKSQLTHCIHVELIAFARPCILYPH